MPVFEDKDASVVRKGGSPSTMLKVISVSATGKFAIDFLSLEHATGLFFVQPGITAPSKVAGLPDEFRIKPGEPGDVGAPGCTGASMAIGEYSLRNPGKNIYIVSGKTDKDILEAIAERGEKLEPGKIHPLAFGRFVCDPGFTLAHKLGYEKTTQELGDQVYYKRFSVSAKNGKWGDIELSPPGVAPDVAVKNLLGASSKRAL